MSVLWYAARDLFFGYHQYGVTHGERIKAILMARTCVARGEPKESDAYWFVHTVLGGIDTLLPVCGCISMKSRLENKSFWHPKLSPTSYHNGDEHYCCLEWVDLLTPLVNAGDVRAKAWLGLLQRDQNLILDAARHGNEFAQAHVDYRLFPNELAVLFPLTVAKTERDAMYMLSTRIYAHHAAVPVPFNKEAAKLGHGKAMLLYAWDRKHKPWKQYFYIIDGVLKSGRLKNWGEELAQLHKFINNYQCQLGHTLVTRYFNMELCQSSRAWIPDFTNVYDRCASAIECYKFNYECTKIALVSLGTSLRALGVCRDVRQLIMTQVWKTRVEGLYVKKE
jgi:hypothetical protein